MEKKEIGKITHFFNKISVAVVKLTDTLKRGDRISIEGPDRKVEQTADSMQIDMKEIEESGAGQEIGLKTVEPVKEGDTVYKISE